MRDTSIGRRGSTPDRRHRTNGWRRPDLERLASTADADNALDIAGV